MITSIIEIILLIVFLLLSAILLLTFYNKDDLAERLFAIAIDLFMLFLSLGVVQECIKVLQ